MARITVDEAISRISELTDWQKVLPAVIGSLNGANKQIWSDRDRASLATYLRDTADYIEVGRYNDET